jgi:hypothetical protein
MGLTPLIEQNIGGLEIAVQNPLLVGIMHSLGNLDEELGRLPGLADQVENLLAEVAAFHQFHADVRVPLLLADLVDRHHMRVLQPGDRFGFFSEPLDRGRGPRAAQPDHLQSDDPVEHDLQGLVDHAHAPVCQVTEDLIAVNHGLDAGLSIGRGPGRG